MISAPDGTPDATAGVDAAPARTFGGREWVFLVAWPWALAGIVAIVATGSAEAVRGEAAAIVIGTGIALLAFVGVPLAAASLEDASGSRTTARAGVLAALCGALSLPALVGVTLASPSASWTVLCGAVVTALAAYALLGAATLARDAYPAVAVLWVGGPPFVYYLLWDLLDRRAEWLLGLGPVSGVMWMLRSASAWKRLWWPAIVLVLAGVALTVVGGNRRAD